MVVLKKVKSSTLMETLVATVLIVVIFLMASMVLNTLFAASITQNDSQIRQELLQLQYQYQNKKLTLPYYNEQDNWSIEVSKREWNDKTQVVFYAQEQQSQKEVILKMLDD